MTEAAAQSGPLAAPLPAVAGAAPSEAGYLLRLYVAGTTPRSARAIENVKRICEERLKGRYDLEIIDLYQQPKVAAGEQIVVAPTLIKRQPGPERRLVGDMSDEGRVLAGLDLRSAG